MNQPDMYIDYYIEGQAMLEGFGELIVDSYLRVINYFRNHQEPTL